MFRIFSETQIERQFRLRRWQALALFGAGIVLGGALDLGEGFPPSAHALAPPAPAVGVDCADATHARATLRLSCTLRTEPALNN
jgi:hypothetical protein